MTKQREDAEYAEEEQLRVRGFSEDQLRIRRLTLSLPEDHPACILYREYVQAQATAREAMVKAGINTHGYIVNEKAWAKVVLDVELATWKAQCRRGPRTRQEHHNEHAQ